MAFFCRRQASGRQQKRRMNSSSDDDLSHDKEGSDDEVDVKTRVRGRRRRQEMMNRNSFPPPNLHPLLPHLLLPLLLLFSLQLHSRPQIVVHSNISHRLNIPFTDSSACCGHRMGRTEYRVHRDADNFINSSSLACDRSSLECPSGR